MVFSLDGAAARVAWEDPRPPKLNTPLLQEEGREVKWFWINNISNFVICNVNVHYSSLERNTNKDINNCLTGIKLSELLSKCLKWFWSVFVCDSTHKKVYGEESQPQ